jgi:adenylosuccinate synthase
VTGHVIVVDLGYGDAGKGTIVDWLCARAAPGTRAAPETRPAPSRPVQAVVRFNGGAQAAHHVLARGNRGDNRNAERTGGSHAFAQFGSGTFTPGTRTFLSRFMLVDPLALVAEAEHLRSAGVADPFGLVAIDRDALLTTPYHRAANQAREEARGDGRHGSCGLGIGETAGYALAHPEDAPRVGDITNPRLLRAKLAKLRDALAVSGRANSRPPDTPEDIVAVYRAVADRVTLTADGYLKRLIKQGPVVFEGAQGVLLDEWRGFHPYTTWSTTTFENAETLLRESDNDTKVTRLGVTRTYQTRHGPGPFPTEDPTLDLPEPHNANGRWQGPFRTGHLDAVALAYAAEVAGGVDAVALTHLDAASPHRGDLRICRAYDLSGAALTRIEPGPPRDLAYQESLTQTLLKARPVYRQEERLTARDWPDAVTDILHAPVTIRSHGPAVTDKTWHLLKARSR